MLQKYLGGVPALCRNTMVRVMLSVMSIMLFCSGAFAQSEGGDYDWTDLVDISSVGGQIFAGLTAAFLAVIGLVVAVRIAAKAIRMVFKWTGLNKGL